MATSKRFLVVVLVSFLVAFGLVATGVAVVVLAVRAQRPTPAAERMVQVSPSPTTTTDTVVLPSETPTAQ